MCVLFSSLKSSVHELGCHLQRVVRRSFVVRGSWKSCSSWQWNLISSVSSAHTLSSRSAVLGRQRLFSTDHTEHHFSHTHTVWIVYCWCFGITLVTGAFSRIFSNGLQSMLPALQDIITSWTIFLKGYLVTNSGLTTIDFLAAITI